MNEYLEAPLETRDIDKIDVLQWWKARATLWPNLARMVKQFLALPASSAGPERVFSAAGKMHTDLRKSMRDDTLEHSLIAAFNYDSAK